MDYPPLKPSLLDSAVDWHVRSMSEDADSAVWMAYEAWLAASPDHVEATRQVDQLLADIEPF